MLLLICVLTWNHHVMHRYQVQREDMSKQIAALQRQLSASQSTAMQAQFAHEEFKEIARDEEEIRELKSRVRELEEQLNTCKGGSKKTGRKHNGRRLAEFRRLDTTQFTLTTDAHNPFEDMH